jgi:hypothetical protein
MDPVITRRNRMSRSAFLVAVLVAASLGAPAGEPQTQPPSFTAGTRTVAVYATVTNARGRLETALSRDDFAIDDNGKQQELTLFSNDVQPITVVMLLDRSGSMMPNFDLEERAAEAFVEAIGPADKARIGSFAEPPIRNLSRASQSPPGRADRHNSGFFIKHKRELTSLSALRYGVIIEKVV